MTIHVFFCFPETAGRTLEEVDEIFSSNIKPWNTHVDFHRVRREEQGEVDLEKKLSLGGHHHENKVHDVAEGGKAQLVLIPTARELATLDSMSQLPTKRGGRKGGNQGTTCL